MREYLVARVLLHTSSDAKDVHGQALEHASYCFAKQTPAQFKPVT